MWKTILIIALVAATTRACRDVSPRAEIVCYYDGTLLPAFLDPCKCTLLIVTKIKVDDDLKVISDLDFKDINGLKTKNPDLKIIISVGGDHIKSDTFVKVVSSVETIYNFTQGISTLIADHKFDGVEINWKWPGMSGRSKSKNDLTSLIKVLRLTLDQQVHSVSRRDIQNADETTTTTTDHQAGDITGNTTVDITTIQAILELATENPLEDFDEIANEDVERHFTPDEFYDFIDEEISTSSRVENLDYLLLDDQQPQSNPAKEKEVAAIQKVNRRTTSRGRERTNGQTVPSNKQNEQSNEKNSTKHNIKNENQKTNDNETNLQKTEGWKIAKKEWKEPAGKIVRPLEKRTGNGKILILSVSSNPEYIAKGYDIKALASIVDLFFIPTYNLTAEFGLEENESYTYHHSRLMGVSDIHNADSLLDLVISMGIPLDRLVLGVPTNAGVFTLADPDRNTPRSPSKLPTWISYSKVCSLLDSGNWTIERDEDLTGTYAFQNESWIAYDDPISLRIKSKYALLRGLAGISIYPLDDDDWIGSCSQGPYPLLTSVFEIFTELARTPRKAVLQSLVRDLETAKSSIGGSFIGNPSDIRVSPFRIVKVVDRTGAIRAIRSNRDTKYECSRQGYYRDPEDCSQFYRCVKFNQYIDDYTVFEYSCPVGLVFDDRWEICAWPSSAPPCDGSSEIFPIPRMENICSEEGYFTDPENCRWFFACRDYYGNSTFTLYEFRCPFGLAYDEANNICNWPWLVSACGEYQPQPGSRGHGKAIGTEETYKQRVQDEAQYNKCVECDNNAEIVVGGNGVYHPEKGIIVPVSYFDRASLTQSHSDKGTSISNPNISHDINEQNKYIKLIGKTDEKYEESINSNKNNFSPRLGNTNYRSRSQQIPSLSSSTISSQNRNKNGFIKANLADDTLHRKFTESKQSLPFEKSTLPLKHGVSVESNKNSPLTDNSQLPYSVFVTQREGSKYDKEGLKASEISNKDLLDKSRNLHLGSSHSLSDVNTLQHSKPSGNFNQQASSFASNSQPISTLATKVSSDYTNRKPFSNINPSLSSKYDDQESTIEGSAKPLGNKSPIETIYSPVNSNNRKQTSGLTSELLKSTYTPSTFSPHDTSSKRGNIKSTKQIQIENQVANLPNLSSKSRFADPLNSERQVGTQRESSHGNSERHGTQRESSRLKGNNLASFGYKEVQHHGVDKTSIPQSSSGHGRSYAKENIEEIQGSQAFNAFGAIDESLPQADFKERGSYKGTVNVADQLKTKARSRNRDSFVSSRNRGSLINNGNTVLSKISGNVDELLSNSKSGARNIHANSGSVRSGDSFKFQAKSSRGGEAVENTGKFGFPGSSGEEKHSHTSESDRKIEPSSNHKSPKTNSNWSSSSTASNFNAFERSKNTGRENHSYAETTAVTNPFRSHASGNILQVQSSSLAGGEQTDIYVAKAPTGSSKYKSAIVVPHEIHEDSNRKPPFSFARDISNTKSPVANENSQKVQAFGLNVQRTSPELYGSDAPTNTPLLSGVRNYDTQSGYTKIKDSITSSVSNVHPSSADAESFTKKGEILENKNNSEQFKIKKMRNNVATSQNEPSPRINVSPQREVLDNTNNLSIVANDRLHGSTGNFGFLDSNNFRDLSGASKSTGYDDHSKLSSSSDSYKEKNRDESIIDQTKYGEKFKAGGLPVSKDHLKSSSHEVTIGYSRTGEPKEISEIGDTWKSSKEHFRLTKPEDDQSNLKSRYKINSPTFEKHYDSTTDKIENVPSRVLNRGNYPLSTNHETFSGHRTRPNGNLGSSISSGFSNLNRFNSQIDDNSGGINYSRTRNLAIPTGSQDRDSSENSSVYEVTKQSGDFTKFGSSIGATDYGDRRTYSKLKSQVNSQRSEHQDNLAAFKGFSGSAGSESVNGFIGSGNDAGTGFANQGGFSRKKVQSVSTGSGTSSSSTSSGILSTSTKSRGFNDFEINKGTHGSLGSIELGNPTVSGDLGGFAAFGKFGNDKKIQNFVRSGAEGDIKGNDNKKGFVGSVGQTGFDTFAGEGGIVRSAVQKGFTRSDGLESSLGSHNRGALKVLTAVPEDSFGYNGRVRLEGNGEQEGITFANQEDFIGSSGLKDFARSRSRGGFIESRSREEFKGSSYPGYVGSTGKEKVEKTVGQKDYVGSNRQEASGSSDDILEESAIQRGFGRYASQGVSREPTSKVDFRGFPDQRGFGESPSPGDFEASTDKSAAGFADQNGSKGQRTFGSFKYSANQGDIGRFDQGNFLGHKAHSGFTGTSVQRDLETSRVHESLNGSIERENVAKIAVHRGSDSSFSPGSSGRFKGQGGFGDSEGAGGFGSVSGQGGTGRSHEKDSLLVTDGDESLKEYDGFIGSKIVGGIKDTFGSKGNVGLSGFEHRGKHSELTGVSGLLGSGNHGALSENKNHRTVLSPTHNNVVTGQVKSGSSEGNITRTPNKDESSISNDRFGSSKHTKNKFSALTTTSKSSVSSFVGTGSKIIADGFNNLASPAINGYNKISATLGGTLHFDGNGNTKGFGRLNDEESSKENNYNKPRGNYKIKNKQEQESSNPTFSSENLHSSLLPQKPTVKNVSLLTKLRKPSKFQRFGPGGLRDSEDALSPAVCERAGLFRHPDSCDKFYECYWDRWLEKFTLHIFDCPVTIVYDSGITACNWPFNGPLCTEDEYS